MPFDVNEFLRPLERADFFPRIINALAEDKVDRLGFHLGIRLDGMLVNTRAEQDAFGRPVLPQVTLVKFAEQIDAFLDSDLEGVDADYLAALKGLRFCLGQMGVAEARAVDLEGIDPHYLSFLEGVSCYVKATKASKSDQKLLLNQVKKLFCHAINKGSGVELADYILGFISSRKRDLIVPVHPRDREVVMQRAADRGNASTIVDLSSGGYIAASYVFLKSKVDLDPFGAFFLPERFFHPTARKNSRELLGDAMDAYHYRSISFMVQLLKEPRYRSSKSDHNYANLWGGLQSKHGVELAGLLTKMQAITFDAEIALTLGRYYDSQSNPTLALASLIDIMVSDTSTSFYMPTKIKEVYRGNITGGMSFNITSGLSSDDCRAQAAALLKDIVAKTPHLSSGVCDALLVHAKADDTKVAFDGKDALVEFLQQQKMRAGDAVSVSSADDDSERAGPATRLLDSSTVVQRHAGHGLINK